MRRTVPTFTGNIASWAYNVTEYLRADQDVSAFTDPKPVQLVHQIAGQKQAATQDGLLMFDPVRNVPVYSYGGTWLTLLGSGAVSGPVDWTQVTNKPSLPTTQYVDDADAALSARIDAIEAQLP